MIMGGGVLRTTGVPFEVLPVYILELATKTPVYL